MGEKDYINKKLNEFKINIRKEFDVERVILFGSRVTGKIGKDIDIDLIIVSKKFNGMDFFQRGAKMYKYWTLDYPVHCLSYTPEEFNKLKKRISIVKEAIETGIEVVS